MNVSILTIKHINIYKNCFSIKFPDINGDIIFFNNHENYISISREGIMAIRKNKNILFFKIKKNTILKYYNNICTIQCDIIKKIT